ncbi:Protein of unknown function [Rhizobiales bacterium GAS191]|jgi:hypothetical protein|nr:Protein of unknown function [Rhizobiales bacterium GAS188]SEC96597.1 Protein of unknown function [Rhizobiales bacterium GAS191]
MAALTALFWMLVAHAVADFPLQGEWLATAKNQTLNRIPGQTIWPGALAMHSLIHAAGVQLATGSYLLAAAEFVVHAGIDYVKCAGRISYNQDQLAHVACKVVWAAALMLMPSMSS